MNAECISFTAMNKYEQTIELQNNCRSFYLDRKKASEEFKQTLCKSHDEDAMNKTVDLKTKTLSSSMDRLRSEMASLFDQDLSLMKQLLTLNETIEELKHIRFYGGTSKESMRNSNAVVDTKLSYRNFSLSNLSISNEHLFQQKDSNEKNPSLPDHIVDSDSGYGD